MRRHRTFAPITTAPLDNLVNQQRFSSCRAAKPRGDRLISLTDGRLSNGMSQPAVQRGYQRLPLEVAETGSILPGRQHNGSVLAERNVTKGNRYPVTVHRLFPIVHHY